MSRKSVALIDHVGIKAGLDHYDCMLLGELEKLNCRVKLFSNFTSGRILFSNVKIFSFRENQNLFSVLQLFRDYKKVFRQCHDEGYQNIILHIFHFNFFDRKILSMAKRHGLKVTAIVHDAESLLGHSSRERIRMICSELIEQIVVHNEYTKEELLRSTGDFIKSKIHIIPHGHFLDLPDPVVNRSEERERMGFKPDQKIILFFGMIKKSKGLDLLLEALSEADKNIHLVIAGRMRKHSFKGYQEIISKKNLDERITSLIRYISNEERGRLMKIADAVVIPYRKVFQSGVLLMAMSYRLPVLSSDLPPNKEIVRDGWNGLLFRNGNKEDLVRCLNELMNNPAIREKLSFNAIESLRLNHSWEKIAQSFYTLIS